MKTTKIRKNNLCKCGCEVYKYTFDEKGNTTWTCSNCHNETKRTVRVSKRNKELIALMSEM